MEAVSFSQQVNRLGRNTQKKWQADCIIQAMPENPSRDLGYVDGRCLHLLYPEALLNVLPGQISNPKVLKLYLDRNPELKAIIDKYGLDIKSGDYSNFLKYSDRHMKQTSYTAGKICDEIKKPADKPRIVKAARLHDIGKIFNKPDNLSAEERAIMDAHSDLGYQLLSTLKIDPKTLELIKNHHHFDKNSSLEQQIVSASDIYSALTEKRPYKKSMDSKQAIDIMSTQNSFSDDIINAFKRIT